MDLHLRHHVLQHSISQVRDEEIISWMPLRKELQIGLWVLDTIAALIRGFTHLSVRDYSFNANLSKSANQDDATLQAIIP